MINRNDNQNPREIRLISATEIASWAYCPEAWRLEYGLKLESGNTVQQATGERHHVAKARVERVAGGAFVLALLSLALAASLIASLLWRT